jgi:hypothetical protein
VDADTILNDILSFDSMRVAAALQAAHGRAEELTPKLVERLDQVLAVARDVESDPVPFIGFLIYLAAEFKAVAAHVPIVQLLRMPTDAIDAALGDVVTEGAGIALADTYPGSIEAIVSLIDDAAADPFARGAGLTALGLLWKRGAISREELLSRMLRVASLLNTESYDDVLVGNQLVDIAVRVNAHEIRGSILELYERDLAEEMYIESDYAKKYLQLGAGPAHETALLDVTISDAWAALKNWHFFNKDAADEVYTGTAYSERALDLPDPPQYRPKELDGAYLPPVPFRAAPKIGRNDPCPCGSGKKYKKCCGK